MLSLEVREARNRIILFESWVLPVLGAGCLIAGIGLIIIGVHLIWMSLIGYKP